MNNKDNSPNEKSTKNPTSIANSNDSANHCNGGNNNKEILIPDKSESNSNIYNNRSTNYIENKFSLFNNRPKVKGFLIKIDIITEKDFLTYKRSLDEYFSVIEKYHEYFDKFNIQKIKKNK